MKRPTVFFVVLTLALFLVAFSGYMYGQNTEPSAALPSAVVLSANGTHTALVPTLTTITHQDNELSSARYYTAHLPNVRALIRTNDPRAALVITSSYSPENVCFLVKLSRDRYMFIKQNSRALELEHSHILLKGGAIGQPLAAAIVLSTYTHNTDGTWTLTPTTALAPGEYALYISGGTGYTVNPGTAFDFGVDPSK